MALRYEGPVYRPPSEAESLLVQATVGCPHNKCTFCMVYKQGPPFKIRPVAEIQEDLRQARALYGAGVQRIFFPAGNTLAMPLEPLLQVLETSRELFPQLERMTVYASAPYILDKGLAGLQRLAEAGLRRVHMGLESGHDPTLAYVRKGADRRQQIEAGQLLRQAGIENNSYLLLGIGGYAWSQEHAHASASAVNEMAPHCLRLRTFVPKVNTPLLRQVEQGEFVMAGPYEVLRECQTLIENLQVALDLRSDHYTNYVHLSGSLPAQREPLLQQLQEALTWDESRFRPYFVGQQ